MAGDDFEIRADTSGATGGTLWQASRVLADVIIEKRRGTGGEMDLVSGQREGKQTFLELGCGTGYLAMRLAASERGTKVIATDIAERMRNLKFNVNRNSLRHAVQCVPWDWQCDPPALDWGSITHCIASEVVYYEETRGHLSTLANTLETIFLRCRADLQVLLMLRVRVLEQSVGSDGTVNESSSTLVPSDSYDSRSAVFDFIESVLPRVGLRSVLLPLGERAEVGLRLYQVHKCAGFGSSTVPWRESHSVQSAIGLELQTAWTRQREIAGVCSTELASMCDPMQASNATPSNNGGCAVL